MFEYVICRYYLDNKHKLIRDNEFDEIIYDNLENAIAKETLLELLDNKGIYYIEHRIKLDYEGSN